MNYRQIIGQKGITAGWFLLFTTAYVIIAFYGMRKYINIFSINSILGSLAVFSSITIGSAGRRPVRFAILSIVFAIGYLLLPAKTILFGSMAMAIFFLTEVFIGKINRLTVFSLVLMCPIFEYLTGVFSFPIRLFLTSVAGKMISIVNPGTIIEGNVIINGTSEFAVDPACMGLHMLVTSLLASLIITSIIQKKNKNQVSTPGLLIIITSIFLLNIISNLFRILCLVYFSIQPESNLHALMGLICFIIYVITPALFIINFIAGRFTQPITPADPVIPSSFNVLLINVVLIVLSGIAVYNNKDMSVNKNLVVKKPSLPGYTITELPDRITKLENNNALIYVKPIAGFYSSDHHPMICWTGSGYQFKKIKEKKVGEHTVYTAILEKGSDVLYSAWWYENGNNKTISQLEWRWKSMIGEERYSLINVTALTSPDLDKEITGLFSLNPFRKMVATK